jgi:hypothetical protein
MKLGKTHTFAMSEKSNKAILYLKKRKINLSAFVQSALIAKEKREREIEKEYPEF